MEAALLYYALAKTEKDPRRADIWREMADMEVRHANYWAAKMGAQPQDIRSYRPSLRVRLIGRLARWFGTRAIIPFLVRGEYQDIDTYRHDPEGRGLVEDERSHVRAMAGLKMASTSVEDLRAEGRHRAGNSGSFRAGVLGFNDGLVSNFSLVMGVVGGTSDANIILLAGVAGLLAGAFSMASGEYISMRAQRDVYEHEMDVERSELEAFPDEERKELELIYRAKGLSQQEARLLAERIMANPQVALDTMAREELGLDPEQLGSPWAAAFSSFGAFATGALVPVLPYIFGSGTVALALSSTLSAVVLATAGYVMALLSGKQAGWGALRMLLIGATSAAITFGIGRLIGVSIS
jgi:VIT1/CCC1 family predicted Fe2+/Mn2+ transporter